MSLPVKISALKRYVALVIEFDPHTGYRPGGVDVRRDRGLFCMSLWQDVDRGIEMRLVLDDRDVSRYEGVAGIEVVRGKEAINAKARELFKPRYAVAVPELFRASFEKALRDGQIREGELVGLEWRDQLKLCYERGVLGMRKDKPYQLK